MSADAARQLKSLQGFKVERVLSEDAFTKSVVLLGRFANGDDSGEAADLQAIVKLSKQHFPVDRVQELVNSELSLTLDFHNDIYCKFYALAPDAFNAFTIDTIYPCTDKHIAKHETKASLVVEETPELYDRAVLPYINGIPTGHIQWVYNILEGKKEADRVLLKDTHPETGFTLLPDLKWDQTQVQNLYCIAIAHRRDIRSLRDLTAEHLPLLRNIQKLGCETIQEKFGVGSQHVKAYLHYHPSYYHLHCHFAHTSLGSQGNGSGKDHLLADVINNITTFGGDFYGRASLSVEVYEGTDLHTHLILANEGSAAKRKLPS
mmetsp:Transcript_8488/g.24332  ORF Transcript_8488/g.24332 Transcript_8488/m.24332 type:complete len:319 (+) Transcript_8488:141-1097(+)|eukprot:CAMPEP_0117654878 /NCGR_PEP_ID=MMETSP0804-20121206/3982_1 /TAXON_ID=1074897 /ORGANISM="Tetraselmis astigmatica, Strain CCMP880" /LENGTH=318 /DNA_ID=CAMNT_0005461195 /DNA_START=133 /DNA_END=1089 /DNA_ORIENTATION=+